MFFGVLLTVLTTPTVWPRRARHPRRGDSAGDQSTTHNRLHFLELRSPYQRVNLFAYFCAAGALEPPRTAPIARQSVMAAAPHATPIAHFSPPGIASRPGSSSAKITMSVGREDRGGIDLAARSHCVSCLAARRRRSRTRRRARRSSLVVAGHERLGRRLARSISGWTTSPSIRSASELSMLPGKYRGAGSSPERPVVPRIGPVRRQRQHEYLTVAHRGHHRLSRLRP